MEEEEEEEEEDLVGTVGSEFLHVLCGWMTAAPLPRLALRRGSG